MVFVGYCWVSVVIVAYSWLSVVIVVIVGYQWLYLVISGYVIYKPWLGSVYAEYTTRGRGQRKFVAEINPERSKGFI